MRRGKKFALWFGIICVRAFQILLWSPWRLKLFSAYLTAIYGCTALSWTLPFFSVSYVYSRGGPHTALAPRPSLIYCAYFQSLDLITVGKAPWTGEQPVARPLPTRRTTQTQNKRTYRYLCLEWDSNPRSQRSSEWRQFMPQTARPPSWAYLTTSVQNFDREENSQRCETKWLWPVSRQSAIPTFVWMYCRKCQESHFRGWAAESEISHLLLMVPHSSMSPYSFYWLILQRKLQIQVSKTFLELGHIFFKE
jgi:hypothetical protein